MPSILGKPWKEIIPGCIYQSGTQDVAQLSCLPAIFVNVLTFLFLLSGLAAVFMIILGGIKFLTSGGDPKQVEGARNTLTWAIVGLILILLSFTILNFIANITGATCIQFFGFDSCK